MSEERFNRLEARFDHMEGMMSPLMAMVGKLREEQEVMKQELSDMKQEQADMKQNISSLKDIYQDMRTENSHRHAVIMRKFNSIGADQEFTWKKAIQNEREIAKLKGQLMGN